MTRKAKTPKFETFKSLPNCFDFYLGQDWHDFWPDAQPVTLELGCGRAELLIELARQNPGLRFVGMDIKSDRMYRPAERAVAEGLKNIVFVRAHARNLTEIFKAGEVNELWLTFPDPYPKKGAAKHRLLHPNFLVHYGVVMSSGAKLQFKTDNQNLFTWGVEQLEGSDVFEVNLMSDNLHDDKEIDDRIKLLTTYERKFMAEGLKIYYCQASRA